jgi:hypothetical protein
MIREEMNREAVPDAVVVHERASASQNDAASDGHAPQPGDPPDSVYGGPSGWVAPLSLRDQHEWFAAVVTTPLSEVAPLDDASATLLVSPGQHLSALERIDIYRRGYHARLVECLGDDYPALAFALGDAVFSDLARGYIATHPSTSPSLNAYGKHFAQFCADQPTPLARFLSDLAALEWAIVSAIHAPTAPTLLQADLASVAPEQWATATLVANPSLQILRLAFPINTYYHAFKQDQEPKIPDPEPSIVAIYRTGRSVWRLPLTPPMALLVESLATGFSLGDALTRVAPSLTGTSAANAAGRITTWFRDAISSGLFSDVHVQD